MQVLLTGSTSHECEVCSFRLSACHQPVILWCAGKHEKAVPLKQPSSNAPLAFIPSGVAVCYYGNSVTFAGGWKTTNGCFLVDLFFLSPSPTFLCIQFCLRGKAGFCAVSQKQIPVLMLPAGYSYTALQCTPPFGRCLRAQHVTPVCKPRTPFTWQPPSLVP